jgi:AraC-like DNA-binding protein
MSGTPRSQLSGGRGLASAPAAALLFDRIVRARVSDALRSYATVDFVETPSHLLQRLTAGPVSLVIVECRDRQGRPTLPTVQAIRNGYPSVPIIAYMSLRQTPSSDILAMAHAGVHELIISGFDDEGVALRAVAESASRRCAATRVLEALRDDLPPSAVPFLQFCLERVWQTPTVAEAAEYLGVHRKTLIYRLRRTKLPSPRAMIAWCRLFVAGHMLEDRRRSVAHVALALDFTSGAALRGMLHRYTGLRPQQVRELGGLDAVLGAFRRVLSSSDAPAPGYSSAHR